MVLQIVKAVTRDRMEDPVKSSEKKASIAKLVQFVLELHPGRADGLEKGNTEDNSRQSDLAVSLVKGSCRLTLSPVTEPTLSQGFRSTLRQWWRAQRIGRR